MRNIDVLYQHPDFVVINKPAGISVQNEVHQAGLLPEICQQLDVERLWLVHRLDKITSGILVLAKNAKSAAIFGQLFEQKEVEKYYLAISSKKPKKKQGAIKGGMKKVRDGKWMLDNDSSSMAITQFFSFLVASGQRLFLVRPLTGKTHQIRVALKSIGSPILGDTLYKGDPADRTYLHAYGIRFVYDNQPISILCPPDNGDIFQSEQTSHVLAQLSSPWILQWPKIKLTPAK